MSSYKFTKDAEEDLEQIVRYTIREWGERQAKQYVDKLQECFQRIADKQAIAKTFSERFPQVLVTRCDHHYVFYLHPQRKPPRIFAILHERMDLLARLKARLE